MFSCKGFAKFFLYFTNKILLSINSNQMTLSNLIYVDLDFHYIITWDNIYKIWPLMAGKF